MKKFVAFEAIELKNNDADIIEICLNKIIPDDKQARKNFNDQSIEELAASIKQHGIIQPIIVRKLDQQGNYQLIAGERRWRASQKAGLQKIPAIVRHYQPNNIMAISLIENIQRENLNALEEAEAIKNLIEDCAMTHHQVAESIGKSRTSVSNLLRLLELENDVKAMINNGVLEMGHARALLSLAGQEQISAAKYIHTQSLSVRATEKYVKRQFSLQYRSNNSIEEGLVEKMAWWQEELAERLNMRVNIKMNQAGKGKLVIQFDSAEEMNGLMERIR